MDNLSAKQVREICEKYNFRPLRRRGQNFLINRRILGKIIKAADLEKSDLVLEIGPGLGFLTEEIASQAKEVLAVEIDKDLVEILNQRLKNYSNVKIVKEDILSTRTEKIFVNWLKEARLPSEAGLRKYKIVANLPYNITSRVLRKFLSSPPAGGYKPRLMVLMVQKEVGERIMVKPPKMNKLALMVQFYSQPKIISLVKRTNFWPQPKVDSVILKIVSKKRKKIDEEKLFVIIRAGFSSPRKYLLNNLKKAGIIINEETFKKLNLSLRVRAQELTLKDWLKLLKLPDGNK